LQWRVWREACDGDAASATRLVRALSPQAFGLAMQLVRRTEDAEDVVQESFLRLWRSAPSDNHGATLSTYFNTIVINRCRTLLVSRRELATDDADLIALHDAHQLDGVGFCDPRCTESEALGSEDARRRLQAGLALLPARQRMALAMWAYADASAADIARSLEIDPNAAHQLLHRAKLALRARLTPLKGAA
jgi:RNA polymerase sigma-70 factor (ECF subfamily)